MDIGNRVYYKKSDNTVIFQTGELSGAEEERPDVDEIGFIDIPFGAVDYTNTLIIGVEDGKPKLKTFEKDGQKYIREIEDELLVKIENETGGIL
ncbi:hypothetical protein [Solibacillus cecembensis]|uniref:hypothetical protein n=1 Tax=Solibacillus cecembensis TaxID=459347 RepID=UPI003CFBFE51